MARLPRYSILGQPQHVIQRGNNREPVFYDGADYRFYLEKLEAACMKHDCAVHAYVLMTNHVHLLMTPNSGEGIGKVMQMLGRYYVQYFNHTYDRTGTLWEGRYKATLLDSEAYLLTCMRYIELNPVRAGMVEHPRDYPWSSYHRNALGDEDGLVSDHLVYRKFGASREERESVYRSLFRNRIAERTLEELREATNKAWVLGNDRFKQKIERELDRQVTPKPRGGDRKSKAYQESRKFNRV
ncbi:MAG: transposase [Sedimenticola sp.]